MLYETVLAREHVALGAKMVPFAGWNMPVQYAEGILAEHAHTREKVSLFDICHMGEFRVRGENADAALDRALARGVADQGVGVCRYNFLLNEKGGVMDDLIVYRVSETEFYIVVNAAMREQDAAEIRKRLPEEIFFADESDATAKLDLQGPLSAEVLGKLGISAESLPGYYHFTRAEIAGIDCILSRTGYTGELGFELYCPAGCAVELWRKLLCINPVKPAGLGARDTLRLEMGYPLYGHEMNAGTTPVEAGFGAMLHLENKREFVGSSAIRTSKPARFLKGFELAGRRTARSGMKILSEGLELGSVTSGTFAPSLGKAIAMGYISSDLPEGTPCAVDTGRGLIEAKISSIPFFRNGTARKKIDIF